MGRYTLVMDTFEKQKIAISLKEGSKKKTKVSLKTIDDLTTQVPSASELAKSLNIRKNVSEFRVTYISNKMCLSLPVAYSDKKVLSRVKLQKGSNINVNNSVFQSIMYEFLSRLDSREEKYKDFYRFAMESNLLNLKQKEYISRRIASGDYTSFCEQEIHKLSSPYRQFRNILFLMEEYDMIYQNPVKEEVAEEIDDIDKDYDDPDKEGFFSEEEKKAYQEYMDNLPDENYEYVFRKSRGLV